MLSVLPCHATLMHAPSAKVCVWLLMVESFSLSLHTRSSHANQCFCRWVEMRVDFFFFFFHLCERPVTEAVCVGRNNLDHINM